MKPNITACLTTISAIILLTIYFIQRNIYQLYSGIILLMYIIFSYFYSYRLEKKPIFSIRTRNRLTGMLGEKVVGEIFIENKVNKTYIVEIMGFDIDRRVKVGYEPQRILMKPKSSKMVKVNFTPHHQGEYRIKNIKLNIVTENTLYYFKRKIGLNIAVSVYPKTYVLVSYIKSGGGRGRLGESPLNIFVRRGFEYIGSRKYYPGDEYRIIDWKATARLQRLMVKEFQDEGRESIAVFLDISNTSEIILDHLAQIAVLVINSAYRKKIPVTLVLWVGDRVKKIVGPAKDRREVDLIYGEILKLFQRIELVKDLSYINLIDTELTPVEKYMFRQIGKIYSLLEKIGRERMLNIIGNGMPKNIKIIFITDLSSTVENIALNRNVSIIIPYQFWKNIENPKARRIAREYYYRKKMYLRSKGIKVVEVRPQKIWKGMLKCI